MRRFLALLTLVSLGSGCSAARYVGGGLAGLGVLGVVVGGNTFRSCAGTEDCTAKNAPSAVALGGGVALVCAGALVFFMATSESSKLERPREQRTLFGEDDE